MEDPSVEWEIVDYSPNFEEEEDGEPEKTRLGWVLSSGLSLGRKLVITGVVVSSVPLVLPSLVVISALGFAFSVPFGVVFASYACTQKVMSQLLPSPAPPIQTTETVLADEEEEVVPASVDLEEKEEREAVKDGVEMRIELVDDDFRVRDEVGKERESGLGSAGEFRNHDVGYLEGEDDDELLNINVKSGGVDEDEIEQQLVVEAKEDDEESVVVNGVGTDAGIGDSAIETDDYAVVAQELGETEQDDARFPLPISQVGTDDSVEGEGKNDVENREDGGQVLEEKDEQVERSVTQVKGKAKDKKRRAKGKGMKTAKEENFDGIKVPQKRKEPNGDEEHEKLSGKKMELLEETRISNKNNSNMGQVDVEGKKERIEVTGQETTNRDDPSSVLSEKEQTGGEKPVMPRTEYLDVKQPVLPEGGGDALLIDDGSIEKEPEPMSLKEMQDDQRVTDDAVADASYKMDKGTSMTLENNNQSRIVADDAGYSVEVAAVTAGTPALKHDEAAPVELVEGKDGGAGYSGLHSDEELSRDEDIWKKIDAIRVIVGFKAPRRVSYVEELKALYLFTGIEPPPSSAMDSSDATAQFSNKLNFLMSVIGLK